MKVEKLMTLKELSMLGNVRAKSAEDVKILLTTYNNQGQSEALGELRKSMPKQYDVLIALLIKRFPPANALFLGYNGMHGLSLKNVDRDKAVKSALAISSIDELRELAERIGLDEEVTVQDAIKKIMGAFQNDFVLQADLCLVGTKLLNIIS